MIIENEAIKLTVENNYYTEYAAEVYKYLNKEKFEDFETIDLFQNTLSQIFLAHNQQPNITYKKIDKPSFNKDNNSVLVCCSAGLDSVFQTLYLRDKGYNVLLFHLRNANIYSNGQEFKAFEKFAKDFGFKYFVANIFPNFKGEYKKFWQENSFKNGLIYSIAIDIMLANNIRYLSSGDDLRLDIPHQSMGVNTGDCNEITDAFMSSFGVEFIPVDKTINKAERLKYIYSHNAGDYYLSCVGPGRLIQSQRKRYETRFGVKLDYWNCGCSCRKDAMHVLLNYYHNKINYPKELIDRAWEKISIGADNIFFDKSIPLEKRIKNLIDY